MMTSYSAFKGVPIPLLIKVREVAKLLSVSRHTVHCLIDSGDLEASKINGTGKRRQHWRVTRKSLLLFYKKRFGQSLDRALENPFES
ncbi:MAG: helix-turn-helix domain-containing protein [Methylacidiphilales bacterium]|nr:helix-turn-helix domain-containing protein [Candidatus Methylacidiphilales bacterium]